MTDNYGWPTTRCFPRTMLDAFPDDAENAQWFYPPEQRWQDKVYFYLGVLFWVVIGIYFWRFV